MSQVAESSGMNPLQLVSLVRKAKSVAHRSQNPAYEGNTR